MIKKYIIDGNNLIGKIKSIWELQQKDKQASREKLAFVLDRYFAKKKLKVSLHYDGFAADAIRTSKVKIFYSDNKTADSKIKIEIDQSKNPKLIAVVSSDNSVKQYAKLNSCSVISSEEFGNEIFKKEDTDREEELIKQIDNNELLRLFEGK
jgi:predicted RNA-binding protein with PIN domain